MLEGTPDVWIDGHLHRRVPGDAVGFPSGTGIAHTFLNDTDRDVRLLVVGERSKPNHGVFYPLNPDHQAILGERDWTDAPKRPLGPHDGKPSVTAARFPTFETLRLRLRQLRATDAQAYMDMRRDPDVGRYLLSPPPESVAAAEREIARILAQPTYAWVLTRRDEDRLLGVVGLPRLDRRQKSTSIAFELHRDEWGKGLMGEAANKAVSFAFDKLGVHRIQAEIDPKNTASSHLVETLGFVREGILRDSVSVNGTFADTAIYATPSRQRHGRKRRFAVEHGDHVRRRRRGHRRARVVLGAADVRREHDVRAREQGRVDVRLVGEDVEACRAERAMLERACEGGFVDDRAARGVHEDRARLHLREPRRVEETACLGGERAMDRDRVGLREQRIEVRNERGAEHSLERLREADAISVTYMHAEAARAAGDRTADAAEAEDAELHAMNARAEVEAEAPTQSSIQPRARGDRPRRFAAPRR